MTIHKKGQAHWEGDIKRGKGTVSTESGVLNQQPYGFNTRFEGEKGTNPEELIGAAHAACFSMALSLMLGEAGFTPTSIDTTADVSLDKVDAGFAITKIALKILGNMHNLFGDTEAVDVFVFPDGSVEVELSDEGDTVADMLQYVQLDPKTLLTQFRDQVKKTDLDAELQQQFLEEFEAGLYGYTYLEDE